MIEEKNQVSESADGALAPGAELLPLQDLPHSGKADMLHRYVGGKEIDLRELVKLVQRKGGPMAVSRCRSWVQLAHQLGASEGRTDLSRSTSSRMKSFYHYAVKELEMRNITVLDLTDAARSEATAEDKTLRRVGGNDIIFTVFKLKCNSCKKEYEPTTDDIKPSHPNSFQPSEYFKACSSCRKYKKNYAKNYRVVVGGAITSRRRGRPRKEEKKFYCPKTIPLPASDVSWPFGGGEAQGVSYCNRGMAIEHWPLVGEHSGEGWGGGGGGEGFRGVETLNMLPQNSEAGCSGFFGLSPYAPPERAAGLWGGGNDHFVPASWLPPPMEAGTGLEGLSSSVFCTWPPTQEKS